MVVRGHGPRFGPGSSWYPSRIDAVPGAASSFGGEPVMACQSDVFGCGHHDVGDHASLEARHPVGQYPGWDLADHGHRFGDQRQRRRGALVGGERDEVPPGERPHRAEQKQSLRHNSFASETRRRKFRADPS
jgi:hypothetical protein